MLTSPLAHFPLRRLTASYRTGRPVATGFTVDGHILIVEETFDESTKKHILSIHQLKDDWRKTTTIERREIDFSLVDRFPDGRLILVASRCDDDVDGTWLPNAFIYDPQGNLLDSFCLDDGIQNMQIDEQGWIWVSYFDEGIYADAVTSSNGAFGLVAFDDTGVVQYKNRQYPIDDCYALNVCSSKEVWFFYYSDYRFIRINQEQDLVCEAPTIAYSQFARYDDYLLAANSDEAHLLRRKGTLFESIRSIRFVSEQEKSLSGDLTMRNDLIVLATSEHLYFGRLGQRLTSLVVAE
ncbi:hypothetical protein RSA42_13540 [Exiguobacterium indicum]|uniref:hypothetical protein n=1 Tax=Exiguobacterium indicum TaxID=296995 RepID=UPI000736FDF4|nr:hypothetical protein [Exiguobacterium indicum]KTR59022.1 hypothetical protein RSA42_13540 [Exiguobacterium indicum]